MLIKQKILPVILVFLALTQCRTPQKKIYNIDKFGAKAGFEQPVTTAIQEAIDQCHKEGGGMVYIPAGKYITGAVEIKSGVNLHLSQGAILKGSSDTADYLINGRLHGMIFAFQAKNIAITGSGIIDGNGSFFMDTGRSHIASDFKRELTRQGSDFMPSSMVFEDGPIAYDYRPGMLCVIIQSDNVQIRDVTFKDSPSWTVRLGDCDNVQVRGVSIMNNLLIPNSDGIHITTSRNVCVSDCDIRAGDDALIVTGFGYSIDVHGGEAEKAEDYTSRTFGNKTGFAENVTVSNCVLQSRSAGIRVGYGDNPIRNCTFSNIVIYGSNRGIGIFSRDKGWIENIMFDNITIENRLHSGHWWGNGEPIHVSAIAQDENITAGEIRNIAFNHIRAESETGILVYGTEESMISNLDFNDIRLKIQNGIYIEEYGGNFDLRPTATPETQIFSHDIAGLYARYTKRLSINRFDLEWDTGVPVYYTHGIWCEYFERVFIDDYNGAHAPNAVNAAAITLKQGEGARISNSVAKNGTKKFIDFENVKDIARYNNQVQ